MVDKALLLQIAKMLYIYKDQIRWVYKLSMKKVKTTKKNQKEMLLLEVTVIQLEL